VQHDRGRAPSRFAASEVGASGSERPRGYYLGRIAALDDCGPRLNAVIVANPQRPARRARRAALPLAGGRCWSRTTSRPRVADDRRQPRARGNATGRDAPLIARMRAAGGVVLGKTNLSEWANIRSSRSSSGWSAVGGLTRNPHGFGRNACGSSSGSGAAIAAGLAWAAIGTETDGSITCPASINGIVGFKPTVGLVSRTLVVPISHSQDTAGPMARSVADAALLLNAIAGGDPADAATARGRRAQVDFTTGLATASLAGVRIGVLTKQIGKNPNVERIFNQALADLASAGGRAGADRLRAARRDGRGRVRRCLLLRAARGSRRLPRFVAGRTSRYAVSTTSSRSTRRHAVRGAALVRARDTFRAGRPDDRPCAYAQARLDSLRLAGAEGNRQAAGRQRRRRSRRADHRPAWLTDLVLGDNYEGSIGAGSLARDRRAIRTSRCRWARSRACPSACRSSVRKWDDAAILRAGAAYERARTAPLAVPDFGNEGDTNRDTN
jgi:amidase